MVSRRFLIGITVLNAAFAAVSISQVPSANAATDAPQVLRGRMLEIVDEKGRVRASIKVHPAERMPDGKAGADTTVLRLINPDGKPAVKIAASETATGFALTAEQGNYLQVFTDGVKVTKGGRQQAAWP